MLNPAVLLLAIAALPAPPAPAPFWGVNGHRAIGTVAAGLLTPAATTRVQALLGDSTLADVSVWADNIRPTLPETGPWHYVNVPIAGGPYRRDRDCPRHDCVIEAIGFWERILADRAAPRGARIEALKYLVHLIGDLHQPLHVGDNQDRGGNDALVTFLDRGEQRLHSVWDSGLFAAAGWTEDALITATRARATAQRDQWRRGRTVDWAEESRRLARDHGYRYPASGRLDQGYVADNVNVAITQLGRAAVRLAVVLERALAAPD